MSFNIGLKAIKSLCVDQSPLEWHRANLNADLFKGVEKDLFKWVDTHVKLHHMLPQIETLELQWPETKEVEVPEPPSYYLTMLENKFFYETINTANLTSQQLLKEDQNAYEESLKVLQQAVNTITRQKYRMQIMDVGLQAPSLVLNTYHEVYGDTALASFGWPYMDLSGPVVSGDVVSLVGRPAQGKSFQMLYNSIHNWRQQRNVLFVSMEMSTLSLAQRITTMYAHTNITQLKMGHKAGYATPTYNKFTKGLMGLQSEEAKFYVVDGNLAASVEDVYTLADQLKCRIVVIDGAYLLRHKNPRLDRFTRVAENVELMKRLTTSSATFASWQFSREASKKNKSPGETVGLEDIGYSDAIGQISSIVLGLFQDDGVETMKQRLIRLLKGRNGEIGQFPVNWDFLNMDFSEVAPTPAENTLAYI